MEKSREQVRKKGRDGLRRSGKMRSGKRRRRLAGCCGGFSTAHSSWSETGTAHTPYLANAISLDVDRGVVLPFHGPWCPCRSVLVRKQDR